MDLNVPEQPSSFNNSGVYTTVGTIINNGSETVGDLWVVTTYYNSAGTVIGFNFTDYVITPSAPLRPGEPARWVATPIDNTLQLTNEITSSVYVIDSTPYSISTQTQTPTPSASGSSSQVPWLPIIVGIAVVVVVVVVLVLLMLFRKRPEAAQASQPPPPPPPETLEQS
jgi:hypothetical protein